jgi:hypothetical protein
MAKVKAPSNVKKGLEDACKKAAKKVGKVAPGDKNEKKLTELLTKEVCKGVDQKILKFAAEELAKLGKKQSAKAPPNTPPNVTGVPKLKAPGSGVPSLTIPITEFILNEKHDTKAKFELKVWADPKDLQKSDKGIMLNFTIVNW